MPMTQRSLTIEQMLAMLAAAPPRMAELTAGLAPEHLQASPAPGQWSANEVLAHLRACADMWGGCIAEILAHNHPMLRAVNPRSWVKRTDYREQPFQRSFEAYAAQRAALLTTLHALEPAAWARSASITGAGRPLERNVRFYAVWLANHERPHLKQIERIVRALPAAH